ncbi:piggyBac transposable element-derived protein 3-like [Aphis gossypii]|uniref:piggyBac transposable element-derived protein 3-like n=1 Tax=Aphis gossypii TaxID=80765 RepID=UPI0021591282|nr:piggyBac transposable element-derived protein 3-like [Aphis gossypii]
MIAPEEFTAIDEIIIPFKGRSVMKQYNKSKPHKWGIKMFALASKSGIIHDFEIYVGKSTIKSSTKMGLSGDIVIRLSNILPKHKNYKLSFDNWFTSYNLILHLKSLGILSVGTVRSNRIAGCQFEKDKDLKKAGRGTYDTRIDTSHGIIGKWYDNKSVHLISNYISTEPTDPVLRWSASEKAQIPVKRPAMVREYNSFMGGIDLHDMLVEIYRTDHDIIN